MLKIIIFARYLDFSLYSYVIFCSFFETRISKIYLNHSLHQLMEYTLFLSHSLSRSLPRSLILSPFLRITETSLVNFSLL